MLAAHPALPTGPAPAVRTVAITDRTVTPNALVVAPSTQVMWTNTGHNRHTVTADAGAFGSGALLPGDDFTISAPSITLLGFASTARVVRSMIALSSSRLE